MKGKGMNGWTGGWKDEWMDSRHSNSLRYARKKESVSYRSLQINRRQQEAATKRQCPQSGNRVGEGKFTQPLMEAHGGF